MNNNSLMEANIYFPKSELIVWENGIKQYRTKRDHTEVLISYIPPGVEVEAHNHKEVQIGMVISGEFLMRVGNKERIMKPLELVYIAPSNILHGEKIFLTKRLSLLILKGTKKMKFIHFLKIIFLKSIIKGN